MPERTWGNKMDHRFTARSGTQSKGSENLPSDEEPSPILYLEAVAAICAVLVNAPVAPTSSFRLGPLIHATYLDPCEWKALGLSKAP